MQDIDEYRCSIDSALSKLLFVGAAGSSGAADMDSSEAFATKWHPERFRATTLNRVSRRVQLRLKTWFIIDWSANEGSHAMSMRPVKDPLWYNRQSWKAVLLLLKRRWKRYTSSLGEHLSAQLTLLGRGK